MGCDIHLYVEQKVDGKWRWISPPKTSDNKFESLDYYASYKEDNQAIAWNVNRNYGLFAMLANVRNGRGFAGIVTGSGFNSISEPRGLPEDISPEIQTESDNWDSDGHSHSWVTLKEWLDYDLEQETSHLKTISESQYKDFVEKQVDPDHWCASISGGDILNISNKEMDAIVKGDAMKTEGKKYYTKITTKEKYKDCISEMFLQLINKLKEMEPNPENIRMVFWFDN